MIDFFWCLKPGRICFLVLFLTEKRNCIPDNNVYWAVFFFFQIIYLFILGSAGYLLLHRLFSSCGERETLSSCSARASHCSGFSCCRAWALGAQDLVAMAHGLSCSKSCGIFLDQGSNPCLLHWQAESLPPTHQGSHLLDCIYFWITRLITCKVKIFSAV